MLEIDLLVENALDGTLLEWNWLHENDKDGIQIGVIDIMTLPQTTRKLNSTRKLRKWWFFS